VISRRATFLIRAAVAVAASLIAAVAVAAPASNPSIALARVVSPTFGVVATSSDSGTRLLARIDGRGWRDVTPPRAPFQPEDIVFLDRKRGWFVANDCVAGRASVYRTSDGGRTWSSARVDPTNCAAGSALALSFIDGEHGWLVRTVENAPHADLERTNDGGVTWTKVSGLPFLGRVAFRTPREGWLARSHVVGGPNLLTTRNGGRTWTRRTLVLPPAWQSARAFPDVPKFFGTHGVLPVTLSAPRRSAIAFYTTRDGGRTWAVRAVQPVGYRTLLLHNPLPRYVPSGIATVDVWWAVAGVTRPRVLVTSDGGRHWSASRPGAPTRATFAAITAAGRASAWLTLRSTRETRLLASSNGGRSWRRLVLPR
jgi:photosystem II stability/assembly factor-like uncharacterized protein